MSRATNRFFTELKLWYTCAMYGQRWLPTTPANALDTGRGQSFALTALTLLALGLRLARLPFQPLWWDEGWSLYFATTDVPNLLRLTAVDIHPPFYYLLLHLWIRLFGPGVVPVRLLSVLIGTATVPFLYLVGRRLLGRSGGLLAAFLLAISPFHIYYSQEVRMYGLVTLLGVAAFYCAVRWVADGRYWALMGYGLAATMALYTQYYAAFLLLGLNLVVALTPTLSPRGKGVGRGGLLAWLGAQAAVVLLYLPWLWYAADKLLTYVQFKVSVEQDLPLGLFTYMGRHLAAFTWGHAEGPLADRWWLGLLPPAILAPALVPLLLKRHRPVLRTPYPASLVACCLLCGYGVNLIFPFNPPRSERLLLLALPAWLLLFTAMALALWPYRRSLAPVPLASCLLLLGSLSSLAFFYTVPRYPDDDYRPVAARIRALGLPTDAIICIHPWQVGYFESYIPDNAARPALFLTPRQVLPRERQLWADDPALRAADLAALLAKHGRLWLPAHQAMGRVLEDPLEAYLIEHAYPTLSEWHGKNTVLSFFATGKPVEQPVTARFGEWLTLPGAALSTGPLEAGRGIVAADLTWQLSGQPTDDYTVGLRLVGPTGYVWAQRDVPPGRGRQAFPTMPVGRPQPDHHGLLVPAGTPPGEYRITLRVYRSRDMAVLPVSFAGGSGGEVTLGTVRVVRPQPPPPIEALPLAEPLLIDLGDRLRLLGYSAPHSAIVRPGDLVEIELFWQAVADPGQDFLPRLQLVAGDRVMAELTEKPVAGTYPTAWWKAGELVRDPHALPIPATVPPGHYRLALSLVRAADGRLVTAKQGQHRMELGKIEVQGRAHRFEPTTPQHPQVVQLGGSVELIGYDLPFPQPDSRRSISLTLHWHALATPDRTYHTFVHLLDAGGTIVAQHDGPPGDGQLPTLGWLPGEYLTDPHTLQLPPDLPAGEYRLSIGLYDPATNIPLGQHLLLDTPIRVPSP